MILLRNKWLGSKNCNGLLGRWEVSGSQGHQKLLFLLEVALMRERKWVLWAATAKASSFVLSYRAPEAKHPPSLWRADTAIKGEGQTSAWNWGTRNCFHYLLPQGGSQPPWNFLHPVIGPLPHSKWCSQPGGKREVAVTAKACCSGFFNLCPVPTTLWGKRTV